MYLHAYAIRGRHRSPYIFIYVISMLLLHFQASIYVSLVAYRTILEIMALSTAASELALSLWGHMRQGLSVIFVC